jgi:anti-sigma factor RsiW
MINPERPLQGHRGPVGPQGPHGITEEELSAWVDGELSEADRARVEAWLADHPDDAARAERWSADRHALQEQFAPLVHEALPPELQAAVWRRGASAGLTAMPRWALVASAAGLLLVGALLGGGAVWQFQQQQWAGLQNRLAAGTAQGWVQRAALAHSVYVPEPRHAVEVKAQEEHLARWLTRRIQVPVKLFDLREQGFELVGGRLLPDGPGKSAQLMYQDARGVRVTIYLRKPEQGTDAAFRYERQGELGMFYWVEEGCGYALVGALPRETLLALAEAIYKQHPAATPPAVAASAPRS